MCSGAYPIGAIICKPERMNFILETYSGGPLLSSTVTFLPFDGGATRVYVYNLWPVKP